MSERSNRAVEKFKNGYSCAQAVVFAFSDKLPFDVDVGLKIACGFGAGMGRKEEVCGAVSGGILVIGSKYGRGENDDSTYKEQTYQKVNEIMDRFKREHGSWICRELLGGCELTSEEGKKQFEEKNLSDTVCKRCVESIVAILEQDLK